MTRQNQILRAWIDRESRKHPYRSNISFNGKVHTLVSPTKNRKAAREFAVLHLKDFFAPKPAIPTTHQPDLFPAPEPGDPDTSHPLTCSLHHAAPDPSDPPDPSDSSSPPEN